jgi:phospholipid-binding lipoprotein MlaA
MNTRTNTGYRFQLIAYILPLIFALTGCATGQTPEDPLEGYNRKVFAFNRQIDKFIYRPVAKTYDFVTPKPIRRGVANFFNNIAQLPTIGNDLLQLNGEWFVSDIGRLIVNTTVGVGGLFDVATKVGIEQHQQDFGLTLAKWGYRKSSYLVVPFLPGATPRDFIGLGGDFLMTPWPYIDTEWWGRAAYGVRFVDARALLLGPDKLIDEAFDPYVFVRDAYLQRRESKIEKVLHPHGKEDEFADSETLSFTPAAGLMDQATEIKHKPGQAPLAEKRKDLELGQARPAQAAK